MTQVPESHQASGTVRERIDDSLDYVFEHPSADLSLQALADRAGISRFHFHRLFSALVGESLHAVVVRARLARAVSLMRASSRTTVTRIALECGFSGSSGFSRSFRRAYGLAPRTWDRTTPLPGCKKGEVRRPAMTYHGSGERTRWEGPPIDLVPFPATRVGYLRVVGAYAPGRLGAAFDQLHAWAGRVLPDSAGARIIGMSRDDPHVTAPAKCRYDIALTIPKSIRGEGDIRVRTLPACRLAVVSCRGDIHQVDRAWTFLYREWLPDSRFLPANLPAMEFYRGNPAETGWQTFDLECAVPVTV